MSGEREDPASGDWHLDKRVPVALIITFGVAIIGQTFVFGWWGATMSSRIEVVERDQRTAAPHGDRLTILEVDVRHIREGIQRIERTLQERPRPN